MWLGSNGKLYAPGASVPADVTKLTAQFVLSEQFSLTPGGRYYFDLSAMDIPGTANSNLPDSTLHYVPFTYVGTVDAYSLKNEADKDTTPYEHSLFIADYNVKCSLQRETLAEMNLIYGQTYTASNVNYSSAPHLLETITVMKEKALVLHQLTMNGIRSIRSQPIISKTGIKCALSARI